MTDKTERPTVTFDANEWRSVIISNLQRAVQFTNENNQITPELVGQFNSHLDRIKVFVSAWQASQQPAAEVKAAPANAPEVKTANGVEPPRVKRKYTKRAKTWQEAVQ